MKMTGNFNPKTGTEEEYLIDFEGMITDDTQINCKIWGNAQSTVGFFSATLANKQPSNFYQISCPKGTKSLKIKIFWAEECLDAYITINGIGHVIFNYETQNFPITAPKLSLYTIPSDIKLGNNVSCETLLNKDYIDENKYQVIQTWDIPNQLFQKIGEPIVNHKTLYQTVKAIELGKGIISLIVRIIYLETNVIANIGKGSLNVEITHPYTLTANRSSTCIGSYVTYTINGLQGEEKIVWKAVQHAKLYNGQGTGTAVFQATEQGYLNVNVTIQREQASIPLNSNEVWSGKPTINTGLETSHVMTERNPVIIDASNEFFHYKGGISYAIESEDTEYVTVTETNKKFKVETAIPGTQRGEIKLRLKVSNDCGEVSNLHTIAYDTLPGLEPAKAIDLFSAKEHEFSCVRTYDMVKYVGNLQTFQMFFSFTLERKATIKYIRPFCTEEKYLGFRIFDRKDEDLEIPLYTHEASDTYMTIDNMPSGEYMMALDVVRNYSDKLEILFSGFIGGSSPTHPYVIEPNENGFNFSDCRSTETYDANFYYKNEQGESVGSVAGTHNTYYILTLEKPMKLIIHTADSKVSTEFHIMQGEPYDWKVLYHETGGNYRMEEIQVDPEVSEELKSMLLNSLLAGQTYVKRLFPAGEYRFVLNGIKKSNGGLYNGALNFNVIGLPITGKSFDTAFDLGTFKEHEFHFSQIFSDVQAHKESGIQKLYYQFHMEKNVNFMLNAKSKSSFLPIVLYNSNKEPMSTSETEEGICINDMLGGRFYFTIDIASVAEDELEIVGKGMFRGRDPYFSYNLGTHDKDFTISDTINTAVGAFYETFIYTDESGNLVYPNEPEARHVYYKITLQKEMQLIIHTTYSEIPFTELHIMIGESIGWNVLYYKDYGCEGIENDPDIPEEIKQNITFGQICVKINLPAGEYKLVVNGTKRTNAGSRNGVLVTNIIGKVI